VTLYTLSIRRPVLATVMSALIVIFGVVSYQHLGVREFPSVDPPCDHREYVIIPALPRR
jgi:multidrug efflux pump